MVHHSRSEHLGVFVGVFFQPPRTKRLRNNEFLLASRPPLGTILAFSKTFRRHPQWLQSPQAAYFWPSPHESNLSYLPMTEGVRWTCSVGDCRESERRSHRPSIGPLGIPSTRPPFSMLWTRSSQNTSISSIGMNWFIPPARGRPRMRTAMSVRSGSTPVLRLC